MMETLGYMMHHDTITGTSRKVVIQDDILKIQKSLDISSAFLLEYMKSQSIKKGLNLENL